MSIEEAFAIRLFFSTRLRGEGLIEVFEELSQLKINCEHPNPQVGSIEDPVVYYHANPSRDRYFLLIDGHEAVMSVDRERGRIFMRGDIEGQDDDENQTIRSRYLSISDHLAGTFDFSFGWIDLEGDPPPKIAEAIQACELPWLYWVNYFGLPYVEKFGKEFLLQAPVGTAQELSNGTIKYMTRSNPRQSLSKDEETTLLEYFSRDQEVKFYSIEQFGFM